MIVEAVTTRRQAEELRVLRNQCRQAMTGSTAEITAEQQDAFYAGQIAAGAVRAYLLRRGAAAVAYGLLRPDSEGRLWLSCGVAENSRGQGLGTLITRHMTVLGHDLNPEHPVLLEVRAGNHAARRVYAKTGYQMTATRHVAGVGEVETWEHRQ